MRGKKKVKVKVKVKGYRRILIAIYMPPMRGHTARNASRSSRLIQFYILSSARKEGRGVFLRV